MTRKFTKNHGNVKEVEVIDNNAPFVRLVNFVDKYKLFSEYDKGVLWMAQNINNMQLLNKEKDQLRDILMDLLFLKEGK